MKKKWYNLLVGITFALPMTVYLFLMATLWQVKADAVVVGNTNQVEVQREDDFLYAHPLANEVSFKGEVVFHGGVYALKFQEDDIIKFKDGYYQYKLNYRPTPTDPIRNEWVDVKVYLLQKEQSYKIPVTFFIALFGIVIVGLVISNKMQWHRKKPRLATFLALLSGTLVLLILNSIIGSILGIFAVATASFGVYCIEYLIQQNKLDAAKGTKIKNDLESILDEAIRKIK